MRLNWEESEFKENIDINKNKIRKQWISTHIFGRDYRPHSVPIQVEFFFFFAYEILYSPPA